MNRRQLIIIVAISLLALLGGVLTSQWIYKTGLASDPAVKAFFANSWQTPDGKTVNTQDWQGKVLVVNFWASWCPPCVEEMPALDKLQQEFLRQNVLFVGIGIDSPSNIREFLSKTPVSYPIVIGGLEGSNLSKQLGNSQGALPYTIIINAKGKASYSKLGKISEDDIRSAIKSAL
ncbi:MULTISPECIES: TlpA disulfide reductase family protein [unclassified Polynucleobacter]|jgi:thiol-disulfide isomerase/thioredoxin|uniref:TlpA family protein disulfide reductase n=1 Tax=unclassified Polynucleobacter TaxID=2640945 RepID=UPI001C0C3FE5|nr:MULTISPECIES: TlpA disulfide reductase family protein [unclassified Polynucleobacter]MBU3604245.1 TlpA family protein disulfide reductase [Polynucleobacter sp. AP-Kaivos-20-H2]MBU3619116.1 TlpA family protein disulfide reductase [Polynucleobacter sp. JS-Fieb-80-E5]